MLLVTLFSPAVAQKADTAAYRNEISFNARNYLIRAFGYRSAPYHQVTYTRFNGKWNWRLGADVAYFREKMPHIQLGNLYFTSFWGETVYNDSVRSRLSANNQLNYVVNIRPGVERVFGKKKVRHLLGTDIFLGIINLTTNVSYKEYRVDTAAQNPLIRDFKVSGINNYLFRTGFSAFYGVQYMFPGRMVLKLRTSLDANFFLGKMKYYGPEGEFRKERDEQFEFRTNGLLTDVSIGYRF